MSVIQQRIDTGLRSTLLKLYQQLINKLTAPRVEASQSPPSNDTGADLVERLHVYITLRPPAKDANLSAIIHANKVSMTTRPEPSLTDRPVLTAVPNSFSQALSERHSTDLADNTAGHKLVQSTLDHLHTSIRCAKAGDTESARLHARIMNCALKEAANYVSEGEYQELVQILDKELNRLS
jgi:hypothetical protein